MNNSNPDLKRNGKYIIDEKNADEMELYCDPGGGKNSNVKEIKYDVMSYKMPAKPNTKAARRAKKYSLMKQFAMTIGVEDNDNYTKFEDQQQLILNASTTKYFIIRFVCKELYNFKLSVKHIDAVHNGGWPVINSETMTVKP